MAVLALAVVGLLEAAGLVRAFVPVALALTTTALGTLLPILRDNDMLGGPFGRYVLAAGAVGEFLPVVAIAIFLGSNGKFLGLISLCAVGAVALLLTLAPRLVRGRVARIMREGEHATGQTTLRWTLALLLLLLVVAEDFGLDVVLGAFLARVVLRRWAPGDVHALEEKLDAVGYGFFIPVFFVASGMGLDLRSIVEAPGRLILFFVLLLAVRGLPTLLVYRLFDLRRAPLGSSLTIGGSAAERPGQIRIQPVLQQTDERQEAVRHCRSRRPSSAASTSRPT